MTKKKRTNVVKKQPSKQQKEEVAAEAQVEELKADEVEAESVIFETNKSSIDAQIDSTPAESEN